MNILQQGILRILKSAITEEAQPLPEGFSLEDALPMITKHGLETLAYTGAAYCGIPEDSPAMMILLQRYCKKMMRSERQMAAVNRLYEAFDEAQIDYMPLKGCKMKGLYPKPELRIMGDADILVRSEQYEAIKPVMEGLGYTPGVESDHEYVWHSEELYLELHRRLIPSYNRDYYAYFGDGWRLAKHQTGFRYTMTDEDTFVYLLAHFAKHYRYSGIGCRHVLDLWVYLRAVPDLNMHYIRAELEKLRLVAFFDNVHRLLEFWFGDGEEDAKLTLMTEFIFDSGNWGSLQNYLLSEEVKSRRIAGSVRGGRLRSLWLTLFPPVGDMVPRFPILEKAPWLLPVLWPVRWVGALLFRRDNIRTKYRDVRFATVARVDDYQKAINDVGLDYHFGE